MRVHDEMRQYLRRVQFPLPVVDIQIEDYIDADGDDALRISVILDEQTKDASLSGAAVIELKAAIRECLLRRGITVFPYIFLTKASERAIVDAGD